MHRGESGRDGVGFTVRRLQHVEINQRCVVDSPARIQFADAGGMNGE